MSFKFNEESFLDNSFNETLREKLTKMLNSRKSMDIKIDDHLSYANNRGSTSCSNNFDNSSSIKARDSKLDILKSDVKVCEVNFPTIPNLEILDLDVSGQPRALAKGICKISCRDALLQIQTEIEANSLLLYTNISPDFTTPLMIANDTFTIPITMTFSQIQLEAITNVFVKNSGVGISFNDVSLDFQFDCSIKLLQPHIAKRLRKSMQLVFKDVLPSALFNMSRSWFTHDGSSSQTTTDHSQEEGSRLIRLHRLTVEDLDLQDLSPVNMLKLSTLTSSRQTLSLHSTMPKYFSTIPGCLDRQNFRNFTSRMPCLSNYGGGSDDGDKHVPHIHNLQNKNLLPEEALEENDIDLKAILSIQTKIYERGISTNNDVIRPRRRKIRIKRAKKSIVNKATETSSNLNADSEITPVSSSHNATSSVNTITSLTTSSLGSTAGSSNSKNTNRSSSFTSSIMPITPLAQSSMNKKDGNLITLRQDSKVLDSMKYFTKIQDLHNIHASFNSSRETQDSNNRFRIASEMLPTKREISPIPTLNSFIEPNRRFSFVGLNHKTSHDNSWSVDEQPPPYY
ncbi:hypothetical protein Kpol_1050p23 [Vanderwaltozyma polyspora DSM 70294]|uniref:Mitochondrial distribution and morphology protein 34 n=1 Tax=Vanderwaltozyma polyspora (strain ATCC 22028 / DSM 70294 / BCRC 21397 / CBS 2163 / NBRC 10782 / NRRL Y-8283 / UCD 57-17) TaxID=436907 RepID=MDM34_VANPO|nr:uncharacterized protein Kpol_1050p23 [Vanderwaltozyma polyspora DSM 70294]A7TES0.1 RecName: Full=Mitochondrial distribution and morphology protein 34 [Vanderwaltozyma polyspora DSM 70294]EDO19166.1 hypothetical protein Kpol_1050p23 [Vanderwaltozyma polyspora DSM 70294]